MRIFVGVDDTDDPGTVGTGEIAERVASAITARGWGTREAITRHQLFVHPDIPYTSHNSAMCFVAEIEEESLAGFAAEAERLIETGRAPGSDPGLCLAPAPPGGPAAELIEFGQRAKREVLAKAEALSLAARLGIRLTEHGGTGGGVIGALAGVGLRMGGEDGRFRGKLDLSALGGSASARALLLASGAEALADAEGASPGPDELVLVGDFVKAILRGGRRVLLLERIETNVGASWRTAGRELVRRY